MPNTTPQAALLSDAAKLADELDHEASKRACNVAMMPASLPVDAAKELRRLDALVAHLTADRDDTANELALRTKHNLALTNERDQLLAKLQATQEPVQAGELPDEREAFEQWWRQRQLLTFPKDYDQSRLADWGAAYKPAAKDAWQARAALSARKPLTVTDSMSHKAFFQAGAICHEMGYVSVAGVQRKLAIGWNEAKAICQHLHDTGSLAGLEMSPHINGIGLEVKP